MLAWRITTCARKRALRPARGTNTRSSPLSACSRGQGAHEPQKATQGGQEDAPRPRRRSAWTKVQCHSRSLPLSTCQAEATSAALFEPRESLVLVRGPHRGASLRAPLACLCWQISHWRGGAAPSLVARTTLIIHLDRSLFCLRICQSWISRRSLMQGTPPAGCLEELRFLFDNEEHMGRWVSKLGTKLCSSAATRLVGRAPVLFPRGTGSV